MLRNLIRLFSKSKPSTIHLGRWQVNTEDCEIARKAALTRMAMANMDSCGDDLCGTPSSFKKLVNEDVGLKNDTEIKES